MPRSAEAQSTQPVRFAHEKDEIKDVQIIGNQRVEKATILTYLDVQAGDEFNESTLNAALKNLFATGFFSDVKLLRDGRTLIVRVEENPVINRVVFEGNDHLDTEELEREIELQPRVIYTRTRVQNDVKRLLDIYRKAGRYSAVVEPKVIMKDQNRIDLVYEVNEGPVARIENINFIGNNIFSSSELEGVIRSSENQWYQFLTDSDKYDADRLKFDQELLRRYYVSQGYADFHVKSAHAELSPAKDEFYITFVLEEGVQYTLSDVNVDTNLQGAEDIDFTEVILNKPGELYNATHVEESIDALTQELGNLGYAFVDITPDLERNRDNNTVKLTYTINPGPRVYVERINIDGNMRTLDEVIRREFRLVEGDPYNAAKLARSEQRLNNLGYFQEVKVTTEEGSAPDRTVINVEVVEQSTGEVNLGAGFSSADGALADFGVRESNLLGTGQELRARVTVASRRRQAEFGFTEPYFLGRELAAGFDVYRTRLDFQDEGSYDLDSRGGGLRMSYKLKERLRHTLNYNYRSNEVANVGVLTSRFIRDQQGKNVTSSVGHALVYDSRNNRFDPTSGYYAELSQDFAGLGGDSKYVRSEVKASYYYPIEKDWTFSVLGAAGYLWGYGDERVLISERFFVGGELIRGFDNAGIGPRDSITRDTLGGNTYYAGTVELRFPLGLPEEVGLTGAAFLDAGSLYDVDETGPEVFDNSSPRVSAGIGFAWKSPFGPIRLDLATPLVKEELDETEFFRINFGTRF